MLGVTVAKGRLISQYRGLKHRLHICWHQGDATGHRRWNFFSLHRTYNLFGELRCVYSIFYYWWVEIYVDLLLHTQSVQWHVCVCVCVSKRCIKQACFVGYDQHQQETYFPLWWLVLCVNLVRPQYPDTWSSIILDVSVKVFFRWDWGLNEKTLSKQITLYTVGGPHSVRWRP